MWTARLNGVLNDPDLIRLVFQPIVDLQRGVIAGYEVLARFTTTSGQQSSWGPDKWFAAAGAQGVGALLEAIVVCRALSLRNSLPSNCFLTVNVSPDLLTDPQLADPLLEAGDLSRVVLELTEHRAVSELKPLLSLLARLRQQGAMIALDDAGSGYSGLQQLAQFRPQIIKLDRCLVADADKDEVKLALAEALGEFAGRIDSWLLAEGIETWSELEAFLRLGVPLGQGYLLGRPEPGWVELAPGIADGLRTRSARVTLVEDVASLVEEVAVAGQAHLSSSDIGIRVDRYGHPIALLLPWRRHSDGPGHQLVPISLRVPVSTSTVDVARRAIARDPACRFDPVVCVDEVGAAVGIVRVERLVTQLADRAASNDWQHNRSGRGQLSPLTATSTSGR